MPRRVQPHSRRRLDLYADGSVSRAGADDTTRIAGSVTFVESVEQDLFSVSLEGAAPNATYTLAISEEPTCANPVIFPDAITADVNGDGSFVDPSPRPSALTSCSSTS